MIEEKFEEKKEEKEILTEINIDPKAVAGKHIVDKLKLYGGSRIPIEEALKKGIYILEINTLPGLTSESLLPKSLNAVGSSHKEFLEHLITLALK